MKLAFAEGFDQAVERNGGESEVDWGDDKPGEMKDKGAALVGVYHQQVSPRIQPTAVETKFSVELPGVPVPVIGFMDLTTEPTVIERKTAGRAEKKPKPDWRLQGSLYQAVADLPVEWHVSVKTKTPAVYTPLEAPDLALARNAAAVGATKALMRTVALGILAYWNTYGPDEPWPGAVTHPWACDFCGFRPHLRLVGRRARGAQARPVLVRRPGVRTQARPVGAGARVRAPDTLAAHDRGGGREERGGGREGRGGEPRVARRRALGCIRRGSRSSSRGRSGRRERVKGLSRTIQG